jgi:beta-glucosidase
VLTISIEEGRPEREKLQPGESQRLTLTADPRILARFDGEVGKWHITKGAYRIALGKAADDLY